jgi:hypothetical protein
MLHGRLSTKQRHLRHLALKQPWLPIVSAVTVRTGLPQASLVGLKYYSSTTYYMAFVLETKHTPPKQNQSRSTLPRYWWLSAVSQLNTLPIQYLPTILVSLE